MKYKYQKPKEIHFRWLDLIKYLTVSLFAVVVFSLLLKTTLADTGDFSSSMFFENSVYSYDESNFSIEIGDKANDQNGLVTFSAVADKNLSTWKTSLVDLSDQKNMI
jgi:hypothetical protein